jgi:glutamate racemase
MIGIFDSGIGGLIVLKEIYKQNPRTSTIYLGDVAHLPYGNKSANKITDLTVRNIEFLKNNNAKTIVIACNSASAYAMPQLFKKFKNLKFFDVVSPAVKKATQMTKNNRIGIIGTKATIQSQIYPRSIKKINPKIKVFSQSTPLLVPLIEEAYENKPETLSILKNYLSPLQKKKIDTLILGCTHYPILYKQIKKIMGTDVNLINSAHEVAVDLKKYLADNPSNHQKNIHKYYVTDFSPGIEKISKKFLSSQINFTKI